MELYLIAGKARSGKNHFADFLKREFERCGKRVCILKISAPLYHYAYDYFNWSGREKEKPRTFLQQMGIEYIKEELQMPNFLINRLEEDIHILDKFFDVGIITDGRLVSEIKELKERYPGIITIHITRPDYQNNLTEQEKNHITEQDLENYQEFDIEIKNREEEMLENDAKNIVEKRMN